MRNTKPRIRENAVGREVNLADFAEQVRRLTDSEYTRLIMASMRSRPSFMLVHDRISHLLIAGREDEALARALSQHPTLQDSDVIEERRLLGDAVSYILEQPMLTSTRVGELLHGRWKNPSDALRKLADNSKIVRLTHPETGKVVYPAFQFADDVQETVYEVNRLLGAAEEEWAAASWWFGEDENLDGATPAERVSTAPDAVLLAARIEAGSSSSEYL